MRDDRDRRRSNDRDRNNSLRGERKEDRHAHSRESSRRSRSPLRRSRSPSWRRQRERTPLRRRVSASPFRSRRRSRSPHRRREGQSSHLLVVGSICRAKVHTIKPFGIFVAFGGHQRHGMVHHSQISVDLTLDKDDVDEDKMTALEYFCPRGSEVWVKIVDIQEDGHGPVKLNCSMKAVDQDSGADLDPENKMARQRQAGGRDGPVSDEPPELGSIHRASVASLRPFGAFVRIEGYRSNGLVHFSQISDHLEIDRDDTDEAKTATIGAVLAIGDTCWVKVVEIKDAEPGRPPKIGCSVKLVSQKDGADLDPHGLKYKPRGGEGDDGGAGFRSGRPVGADAGVAQQGVVDWGYLNADKIHLDPQYGSYELVGAEAEQIDPRDPPTVEAVPLHAHTSHAQEALQQGSQGVSSVEEALAILRKHKKKSKKNKDKDRSKKKKKHKEERKSKKQKKQATRSPSGSSSDSD